MPEFQRLPVRGSHTRESTCLIAAHVSFGPVIHLNAKMLTNTLTWSRPKRLSHNGYLFPTSCKHSLHVFKFVEVRLAYPGSVQSQP
jgi:hypothetical protein